MQEGCLRYSAHSANSTLYFRVILVPGTQYFDLKSTNMTENGIFLLLFFAYTLTEYLYIVSSI